MTLLQAGGWDERDIVDAKTLFKARAFSQQKATPLKQEETTEEKLLPDGIDPSHLLLDHNDQVPMKVEEKSASSEETPSLLVESSASVQKEEFPHNLPLRPFETSEHIWSFSRYRDVFHGEPEVQKTESPHESARTEKESDPTDASVQTPTPKEVKGEMVTAGVFKPSPVSFSVPPEKQIEAPHPSNLKGSHTDENLVILACFMLFVVLLLLGYMYSNGRL